MSRRDRTTVERAQAFDHIKPTLARFHEEVSALAKKKPQAELAPATARLINRVLGAMRGVLIAEPEGGFLDRLRGPGLTVADAAIVLAQYATAMMRFSERYKDCDEEGYNYFWYVTNGRTAWRIKADPW